MDIDTVRYSVPYRHVRETVEAVVEGEQVAIWSRGTCIARHRRCDEPHALVRIPAHFEGLFRRPAPTPAPALGAGPADPVARPLSIYAELVEGGRPWTR